MVSRREAVDGERESTLDRRRLLLTAGGIAAAASLAGCSSVTDYEFTADPVVLPGEARTDLNYETVREEPVVVERSRTVGGLVINATVASRVAVYASTADREHATAEAPSVGAVSTPKASVMGRSFNPLARLSLSNLLTSETGTRVLERAGLEVVGHSRTGVGWRRGPTLIAGRDGVCMGVDTSLESYAGVLAGRPPTVAFVHLARVDADGVVIALAIHGHDVEDPGREFVGPTPGYLSPDAFDAAVDRFDRFSAALAYRERTG